MSEDLLSQLNPEQKEAVTHKEGPLLIVAGAGTGKTNVITKRIVWLILEKKAKPDEILALTFTEKAAAEMEERVDKLLPYGYLDLWISTFHSFCQRILEQHAVEIGLSNDFKLLSETQQWILMHNNFEQFELDYYRPLGNPTKFIHALLKHFSRAKDEAIMPEDYLEYVKEVELNSDSGGFISQILSEDERKKLSAAELKELTTQELKKLREVADAYHTYQQLLFKNNAMDFGDLIVYCLRLFQQRPKLLAQYRAKFKYILVDEFQDTNWAQYELIKLLAAPANNLTVTGDDDQSVYKFRGASISNVLQFKNDYPKLKQVFLINNYRSCQNILDLAYHFIQLNNPERLEVKLAEQGSKLSKRLLAQNDCHGEIKLFPVETQEEEMKAVIAKILELKEKDKEASWSDFAILVRANSQADLFNFGLAKAKIPYQFLASRGLYQKKVVLDILAYLKLLDNYHESPAMYRILSLPIFEIAQRELVNLNYWAGRRARSLYQVCLQIETLPEISAAVTEKIKKVLALLEKHTAMAREKDVSEIVLAFLEESGYLKKITEIENAEEVVGYLNQFYKKIAEFEAGVGSKSVRAFVQLMDLEIESGEQGALQTDFEAGPETVKVMTAHAAKGLEFSYVFIVNLVEQRFPTRERREQIELPDKLVKEITPSGDVHLQEERRLFYVACTRAKVGLYFLAAKDYGGARTKKPSQFLHEVGILQKIKKSSRLAGQEIKTVSTSAAAMDSTTAAMGGVEGARKIVKFSFSQLKAYESCPWQYRFAYILKVPVSGKYFFSFGKTIHSALNKIFVQLIYRQAAAQGDLFVTEKSSAPKPLGQLVSFKEIEAFYTNNWIDDWYLDEKHKQQYFKKGKEMMQDFYKSAKDKVFSPVFLEKGFNARIVDKGSGRSFTISGAMDRVDGVDGGYEIIDYKTGGAKDKLQTDDKDQLLIYQLAGSQVFAKPVKKLTFLFLEGCLEQSFLGAEKDLAKIQEKIIAVVREIERGEFKATPGVVCQFCDFRGICEFRAS